MYYKESFFNQLLNGPLGPFIADVAGFILLGCVLFLLLYLFIGIISGCSEAGVNQCQNEPEAETQTLLMEIKKLKEDMEKLKSGL